MKILQIAFAGALAIACFLLAEKNGTLVAGIVIGASLLFIFSALVGQLLMRSYISRVEKRERDYLQEISQAVEKD